MNKIIVDTNVLIDGLQFDKFETVVIPIVVIEELDHLKMNKDFELSLKARRAIRSIEKATNKIAMLESSANLPLAFCKNLTDNEILRFVIQAVKTGTVDSFYTKDLNLKIKARFLDIPIYEQEEKACDIYKGYREVVMTDQEIANHYGDSENKMGLFLNEYLIIKNEDDEVVDRQKWNGKGFIHVPVKNIGGKKKGEVDRIDQLKPFDAYQACAIDSLNTNGFTVLTGKAGSGKTLIALSWLVNALDSSSNAKLSKIIIVHNNAPLKGAEKQGYYPGTRTEKLLQSNLGGILASKLGSMFAVEQLIKQERIELVPASDLRGIEVSSSQAIFITEGQNMDAYILKTAIQRAKEGAKIIVEGDILEQQDMRNCPFEESGIYRAIEVFKNTPNFGCIKLKTNYRSPLAELADKM
jgi:PhoH-like ATPase